MSEDLQSKSLEELLVAYSNTSIEAFEEFYRRTNRLVYNFVRRKLHGADVDDVFQETYFRVHRYISSYDPQRPALVWLLAIARNTLIDRLKMNAKTATLPLDPELVPARGATDERLSLSTLIEELFEGLSQSEVLLVVDRVFNEETYEDIGQKHGLSVINARQKVSRLLKRLKTRLS